MSDQAIKVVTNRPEYFEAFGWTSFAPMWDALQSLDSFQEELEVDTETTGLRSYLQEKLLSVQLANDGDIFIFDVEGLGDNLTPLKRLIEGKTCFFHNAAFDMPYLFHYGIVPKRVIDTQVVENVLTMGLKTSKRTLAAVAQKYLGIDIDKSQQAKINQGFKSIESVEYAGTDVMYLRQIYAEQKKAVDALGLGERVRLENLFVRVMAYMEFSGVFINKEKLKEHVREVEWREWAALKKLREKYGADINWNSSPQVLPILKSYGIEEIDDKTGRPSKNAKLLAKHRSIPFVADLLEYSEAQKEVTSFGRRWFHYIQEDGRVHTKYKQFTSAGRTSCGNTRGAKGEDAAKQFDSFNIRHVETRPYPNVQQIPRRGNLRECFIPKRGNKYVICDYSSQESVIMAEMSGDPNMIAFFETGSGDLHSYTARLIYKDLLGNLTDKEIKSQHGELRTGVKSGNFAIAYGGNEYTIAKNLNISVSLAKEVYDGIMSVFTRFQPYFRECMKFTEIHGYIPIDPVGGKRFFPRAKEFCELANDKAYWNRYYNEKTEQTEWWKQEAAKNKWYFMLKKKLRKESVNSRIQGYAAFMSKLAGIYILDYIEKKGYWGKVLMPIFVHDEWVTEQSEKLTPEMMKVVKEMMELAAVKTLKRLKTKAEPMEADYWHK